MSFPSDMTAPPAGALEACLALLEKAVPGPYSVCRGDVVGHDGVPVVMLDDGWDNAEMLAACAELVRTHGPALLAALRLREWRPIAEAPWDEVVLLCDANGNRWTDCAPRHPANGCGMPAIAFMPLPAPPTADDLARVLEESATGDEAASAATRC